MLIPPGTDVGARFPVHRHAILFPKLECEDEKVRESHIVIIVQVIFRVIGSECGGELQEIGEAHDPSRYTTATTLTDYKTDT